VHAEIAADFMEARRVNPRISANGFAKKNAERHLERFGLAPETVRKIAGNALRRAKNRTSAS
jgi:diaminopimelate decarboxylase